jgi:hypothetical protein
VNVPRVNIVQNKAVFGWFNGPMLSEGVSKFNPSKLIVSFVDEFDDSWIMESVL